MEERSWLRQQSLYAQPAVIARERPLRPKQSPTRQGDGYAEFTLGAANVPDMTITTGRHCEGAFFATEAIPNPARRWLRFARHDRCRQGDGYAEFTLSAANVPAMTGTARCHCEGAPVATEAIPNPARRWLRFARHDRCWQGDG